MQKIIQFTRDEVVSSLEARAEGVLETFSFVEDMEPSETLRPFLVLISDINHLLADIEYFDVYINRGMFSAVKNILVESQRYLDNHPVSKAEEELAALKEKLSFLM